MKLQKPLVIPRGRVDTLIRWLETNQRKFSPAELGLNGDSVQKSLPPLHLPPPQNLVIDVDSFSFCAKTPQEKRLMKDWNFGEYLRARQKK